MKFLIILTAVSLFFITGMFLLDGKVVSNLPDNNRFKKWWRKNLIGEMKEHD